MSREQRSDSGSPSAPHHGSLQPHSCMLCKQRKVKCDKRFPCSQCSRARAQCIFRAPAPPRRGKRKPTEVNLLARLKRYEDMLQALGVSIDTIAGDDAANQDASNAMFVTPPYGKPTTETAKAPRGTLISGEEGKSIYFENLLWKSLSDEIQDSNELLQVSSEEEEEEEEGASPYDYHSLDIVLSPGKVSNIRIPHPQPAQILRLWQAYVHAVNPLCKIIHEPTMHKTIAEVCKDVSQIPKSLEALLFAIYALATYTLEPEEFSKVFQGEKQTAVMERYTLATQLAFQRAGLLRSADMTLLQAFVVHLFLLRIKMDHRILWIYTGIAVRLAQRLGMHRDGTSLDIGPFETEMRRRLWWQVIVLDTHAAQLSGAGASLSSDTWDAQLPLNINDSDIWPDMTEPLEARVEATEMFFCMVRFEFGRVFRDPVRPSGAKVKDDESKAGISVGQTWAIGSEATALGLAEKDRRIDAAERRIGDRFLRFVDAFNDLHVLALGVARTAIASMRLMVHHPRHYADGGASLPAEEKEALFANATRIIEYDRNAHSSPNLRRFRWHYGAFFQANAFIYVLSELCRRTAGPTVEESWRLVGECFRYHPEILHDHKRLVHIAIGNLTLRAWHAYATAQPVPPPAPAFITALTERRASASARTRASPSSSGASDPSPAAQRTPAAARAPPAAPLHRSMQTLNLSQQQMQLPQQQQQQQQPLPAAATDFSADPLFGETGVKAPDFVTDMFPSGVADTTTMGAPLDPMSKVDPILETPDFAAPLLGAEGAWPGVDTGLLGAEPMDWAAWDDLIANGRLEGYGVEESMAFGFSR